MKCALTLKWKLLLTVIIPYIFTIFILFEFVYK